MAKVFNVDPTGPFGVPNMTKFYDITNAVGIPNAPGKDPSNPPNDYLDVLLVQYLLEKAYEGDFLRPVGKLLIDGVFGPLTHYWMLFFYVEIESEDANSMLQERGNFVPFVRNITSRFDNDMATSLMGQLNVRVFHKVPQSFATLSTTDPHMPPALRQAFNKR